MKCTVISSNLSYSLNSTHYTHSNSVDNDFITANKSLETWHKDVEDFLYEKVILVICLLGMLGNILTLIVLSRKCATRSMDRMETSAHMGLLALAVSDFLFCISTIPHSFQDRHQFEFDCISFRLLYRIYGNGVINIFIMSSTWLTVVMAMCRYLAICFPLRGRLLIGKTFTALSICGVFVLCVLFNLPRFWTQKVESVQCSEGYFQYYASRGVVYSNTKLEQVYAWMYFIACIFVPFLILAYCNAYLIRALRTSRRLRRHHTRSRDLSTSSKNTLTLTLVVVIVFYIILVTPTELLHFAKYRVISSPWLMASQKYNLAVAVCNTLQAVNFAINFVLYCTMNAQFLSTVKSMFSFRSSRHSNGYASAESIEPVPAMATCSTRV